MGGGGGGKMGGGAGGKMGGGGGVESCKKFCGKGGNM